MKLSKLREIEAALPSASEQGGEDAILGIAATYLPTGESVLHNADMVFPTASVIKIAIVAELFTQAAEKRIDLSTMVTLTKEVQIAGSGVLGLLTPGLSLSLTDLATLTISISDNTASNLCLAAVGGAAAVNTRMQKWGLKNTTIHRPIKFHVTPEDPPHTATGTPHDFLYLLRSLVEGKIHSREVSDTVLDLMGNVQDDTMLPCLLEVNPHADALNQAAPPYIVQHKTGAVTGVRNDVGLIIQGDRTLAVAVFTKGVADPRWTSANAGNAAVAQVGKVLTEYFFR